MFQVNDVVLYGVEGVCRIVEKTARNIGAQRIEYYVLKSCGSQNNTVYVPTQNQDLVDRMRKVLSEMEVMELIRTMPDEQTIWIDDDNQRAQTYERILAGADRSQMIQLIKTLNLRRKELTQSKRKMHAIDEKMLHEAEHRLYDEFAHALNIDLEDVLPFINQQIERFAEQA